MGNISSVKCPSLLLSSSFGSRACFRVLTRASWRRMWSGADVIVQACVDELITGATWVCWVLLICYCNWKLGAASQKKKNPKKPSASASASSDSTCAVGFLTDSSWGTKMSTSHVDTDVSLWSIGTFEKTGTQLWRTQLEFIIIHWCNRVKFSLLGTRRGMAAKIGCGINKNILNSDIIWFLRTKLTSQWEFCIFTIKDIFYYIE